MSTPLRILHCADLHLVHPLTEGFAADAFATLRRIIDFTEQIGASVLLIAGDLFDSVHTPERLVEAVQKEFSRCSAEVFIAAGNHDYLAIGAPLSQLGYSSNVHIFPAECIHKFTLPQLGLSIYGKSFDAPHCESSPFAGFTAEEDGSYRIGLFHADVTAAESRYAPIRMDEIDRLGLDYLALGHKHAAHNLACASKTIASYPGTPPARRFSDGFGGVNLISLENSVATLTHHDLCVRQYLSFEVDVTDCSDSHEVAKRMLAAANDRCEPKETCCRITLVGVLQRSVDLSMVKLLLQDAFYQLECKDQSNPPQARPGQAEYSLQSIFLQKLEQKLQDCTTEEEVQTLQLAIQYGLQAFYGEVNIDAD